jgi:hypothetical protein
MSRQLQCEACAAQKKEGKRIACEAEGIMPAEWERVIWGVARHPRTEQRWMTINGDRMPLPMAAYNCDLCSAEIVPGQRACAWTIWADGMAEPPAWEDQFLIPEVVPA